MNRIARHLLNVMMLSMVLLTTTSCVRNWEAVSFSDKDFVTEQRDLRDFEKIEIFGSPTVYFTQADSFSVKVKGPENLISDIITDTQGRTLSIRNRGKVGIINMSVGGDRLSVYVSSPDLIGISLFGSGDFISERRIDTDKIDIALKGSGDIHLHDLICDDCHVELIGSGDVDIDRLETATASAVLIGSGDIDLREWNVQSTSLALKGSGDIDVSFEGNCGRVDCELQGSGDISLKGRIGHLSKQKRGSGDIDTAKLMVEK